MKSPKTTYLFVHIPKAAGGSIVDWFRNNNLNLNYIKGHKTISQIKELGDYQWDISFCVVRNPYKRLISFYNWIPIKASKEINRGRLFKVYKRYLKVHSKGLIYFLDFYKDEFQNPSQVEYTKDVDLVLKYENLNEDFKQIQRLTNCFQPLTKTRHINDYDYKEFYTEEYFKKVEEICGQELEVFDYKPYD